MKKKILFTLVLVALFTCLLVVAVGAAAQSYSTFDVTLTDGTTKTAYTADSDQYEGRVYLNAKLYAEAPFDNEGTYEEIAWSDVKVLDFSNSMLYIYDGNKKVWNEKEYGSNQGNTALCVMANDISKSQCTNLEKIITGKIVTVRGSAFGKFPALKEVVISKGTKELQYNAFERNPLLEKVTFEDGGILSSMGNQVFIECPKLTSISLPNTLTSMGDSVFQNCTALKSINWSQNLTTIPSGTFFGCTNLEFEIPSYITNIKSNALRNCDSLTVINVPLSVTSIGGYAFAECDNLTAVNFPENNQITGTFIGIIMSCPKITSFQIPAGVTTLGYDNFWHCKALTEIDISGISQITGGNNFADTAITKLEFSNELTNLPNGNVNSILEEIRFGANIQSIGASNLCIKTIKRVYLPATVTTLGSNILGWSNSADSSYNITFIFTGTRAEAEALQAYYKEWTLANNPGHAPNSSKLYDAVLVSASEFDVTAEPVGYHFVYGYNKCEAFYDGQHTISDEAECKFEGEDYVSRYISVCACTRGCGEDAVTEIAGPLFTNKGYSVYEENGKGSIAFGLYIDEKNISDYEAYTGEKVTFGFVIGSESSELDGNIIGADGACLLDGAIVTDFATIDFKSFSIYNLKLTGISTDLQKAKSIYCSAYVLDGDSVSYIGDSVTKKALSVSYNSLFEAKKDEQ